MDTKVLSNILKIAQKGSMTYAAEASHITLQALAAQLNKLEDQLGFKMFYRTNKGMVLTKEGAEMMPFISEVIHCSENMMVKANTISNMPRVKLCVALNSTLGMNTNENIMGFIIEELSGYEVLFSSLETPDSIAKIESGDVDMAVIIAKSAPQGFHSIKLPELQIRVVAAHFSKSVCPTVIIKPLLQCPYAISYEGFLNIFKETSGVSEVYQSGSELVSVSIIKSFGGIGLVSSEMASINSFYEYPGFEDFLDVYLIMRTPMFNVSELHFNKSDLLFVNEIKNSA
jgi:DNA-binding transcriptional LysR family regulator